MTSVKPFLWDVAKSVKERQDKAKNSTEVQILLELKRIEKYAEKLWLGGKKKLSGVRSSWFKKAWETSDPEMLSKVHYGVIETFKAEGYFELLEEAIKRKLID